FNFTDASEVFHHPFDHGFSGNIQKRLRLVQGEGIKAGGIAGGENQNIHQGRSVNGVEVPASKWSGPKRRPMQFKMQRVHPLCSSQLGVRSTIRDIKSIDGRSAFGANPSECDVNFISAKALQRIVTKSNSVRRLILDNGKVW